MNQKFSLKLKNDFKEFSKLTLVLEKFGKENYIRPKIIFQIIFSLEEIFNNIVLYGYKNSKEKEISFDFEKKDKKITVTIEDDADLFNPLKVTKPDITSPLETREPGGLGIYLIHSLMNRVRYKRENNKNILTIEKDLTVIKNNKMGD